MRCAELHKRELSVYRGDFIFWVKSPLTNVFLTFDTVGNAIPTELVLTVGPVLGTSPGIYSGFGGGVILQQLFSLLSSSLQNHSTFKILLLYHKTAIIARFILLFACFIV